MKRASVALLVFIRPFRHQVWVFLDHAFRSCSNWTYLLDLKPIEVTPLFVHPRILRVFIFLSPSVCSLSWSCGWSESRCFVALCANALIICLAGAVGNSQLYGPSCSMFCRCTAAPHAKQGREELHHHTHTLLPPHWQLCRKFYGIRLDKDCMLPGRIYLYIFLNVCVRLIYTLRTRMLGKANFVLVLYYSFTLMGY